MIQPQIQKRTVNVQPFITIVAVLFGATLLGVLGALVAIPVAASIQILVREYVDVRTMSIKDPATRGDEPPPLDRRRLPTPPPRSLFTCRRLALVKRGLLLAITGVSLYLLAPALLEVFGAFDQLDDISPLWFVAMIVLQAGSYACMWAIQKIAVRSERWGPVITSQLASNAFGRVVPGGVAAAGAMQYAMLARGGVPAAAAASGMTASSLLVFGILLAMPLLAVPAIVTGVAVDPRLARAAEAGAVIFVAMIALGVWCVVRDRPLELIGTARPGGPQPRHAPARADHRPAAEASARARHRRPGARRSLVGGAAVRRRAAGCSTT